MPPPAQQHRILRLVIEIAGCSRNNAAALQAAVQRQFEPLVLAEIERACTALADAGQVQRIARLELQLGRLPASAWLGADAGADADAPANGPTGLPALQQRLRATLAPQLALALQTATPVQADEELVASFLQTGTLPWWADASDRQVVQRALAALVAALVAAMTAVRSTTVARPAWLPAGPADGAGWQRLVAALDDGGLARLLQHLAGAMPGASANDFTAHWPPALARAATALGQGAAALRQAWWTEALAAAAAGPVSADAGAAAFAAACQRLPHRLGLTAPPVARALRLALDAVGAAAAGAVPRPLWQALERAWPTHATQAALPSDADARAAAPGDAPVVTLAGGPTVDGAEHGVWLRLARLAAELPGPEVPHAASGGGTSGAPAKARRSATPSIPTNPTNSADSADSADSAIGAQAWAAWLRDSWSTAPVHWRQALALALAAHPVDGVGLAALLAQRLAQAGGVVRPAAGAAASATDLHTMALALARRLAAPNTRQASPPRPTPPAPPAATLDALYITNAGLVLLWPFIQRFADRLGLLQAGRFVGQAQAWRAVLLLQHLATGDAQAVEFQLPLNKLLVGLPLEAVLTDTQPLSDDEQAECDALLRAVIASAPVLRQMSLAGFRSSFLQRAGQLSGRDGHWLLRVEPQAWDVVLARFPWSASLVRLPWMPRLLQVQW